MLSVWYLRAVSKIRAKELKVKSPFVSQSNRVDEPQRIAKIEDNIMMILTVYALINRIKKILKHNVQDLSYFNY